MFSCKFTLLILTFLVSTHSEEKKASVTKSAKKNVTKKSDIVGKWKVKKIVFYGRKASIGVGEVWKFDEKGVVVGIRGEKGSYKIVKTAERSHVDVQFKYDDPAYGGAGPRKGIIAVQGKYLRLCIPGSAKGARPKQLVSEVGSKDILRIFERVEK